MFCGQVRTSERRLTTVAPMGTHADTEDAAIMRTKVASERGILLGLNKKKKTWLFLSTFEIKVNKRGGGCLEFTKQFTKCSVLD